MSTFDKIYTMLRNVYMVGQNIQRNGLEELLFRMTSENKIAFNGQAYSVYQKWNFNISFFKSLFDFIT